MTDPTDHSSPARLDHGPVAPVTATARITNLDTLRGFAVLGILVMNSVGFVLPDASYFRIDGPGTDSALDWTLAVAGEIFVDQKFMALFSMLFGAGIALFADRSADKGRDPFGFSLWRNFLLLLIGLAHTAIWAGDVLVVYAICSPAVVLLRNAAPRILIRLGTALVLISVPAALLAQLTIDDDGRGLGQELWLVDGEMSGAVLGFVLVDYFGRALGMMLIGVVLYRNGFLTGTAPASLYRRAAAIGLGAGLTLATIGVVIVIAADFAPSVALVGLVPNTLGTIPAAVGYAALVALWDRNSKADGAGPLRRVVHHRLQAVGRMALTNYLTHSVLGVLVLASVLGPDEASRTQLALFVVGVWILQLAYSAPWLARFRYGPAEWLWRCATYRRLLPIRR
ncbi:MAG: DUF418 domain-containing protein [Actinomycetota bacterium]